MTVIARVGLLVALLTAFASPLHAQEGDLLAPLGVEGEQYGKWVLLDYDDVIVHIFYEPLRELYEIERLWADAPKMEIDEKAAHLTDLTCE